MVNFIYVKKHLHKLEISLISRIKKLTIYKFSVLWKFSLPAAVSSMIMPPVIWWAKTLLVRESGFGAMATFDVAEQWRSQILFVPGVLATIILPVLAKNKATDSKSDFLNTLKINLILNVAIVSILSILVLFAGDFILSGYGDEFNNAIPLYILAFSAILISFSNIVFPILMTYNKIWIGVIINIIWAFFLVITTKLFLGMGYAENGLAAAIFFSYCISLTMQVFYVRYLLKYK